MNCLVELKKYLDKKYNALLEEKAKLDLQCTMEKSLGEIIKLFEEKLYDKIDLDTLDGLLCHIHGNNNHFNKEKIFEAITLSSMFEYDFPQIIEAKNFLNKIQDVLIRYCSSLSLSIYKNMRRVNEEIDRYKKYISYFNENGIVKHLNEQELNEIVQFISESNLDKNIIIDLCNLFWSDSLEHCKKSNELLKVRTQIAIGGNARGQQEKINPVVVEESATESVEISLNENEQEIVNKINDIIDTLKNDKVKIDKSISCLLQGNYDLNNRKKIYESSGDVWGAILSDLIDNLIPNIANNREQIFSILEYIIEFYAKNYSKEIIKEEVQFISNVSDFSVEDKKALEELMILVQEEIRLFDSLSVTDKNNIHSCISLIKEGRESDIDSLGIKFDSNYVKKIYLCMEFIKYYNEYIDNRREEKEIVMMGMGDEVESQLRELMTIINNIKDNLLQIISIEEKGKDTLGDDGIIINGNESRHNIVLFLGGLGTVCDDIEIIKRQKKDSLKNIPRIFVSLNSLNFEEYRKMLSAGGKNTKVKCDRKYIADAFNPHKMRAADIRVGYITVPLSENNKKELRLEYDYTSDVRIVLIFGIGLKLTDSNDPCVEFESRLDAEFDNVRRLIEIFKNDFTEETREIARSIIDEGISISDKLIKNPADILDSKKKGGE